jgi:hypothetical protein
MQVAGDKAAAILGVGGGVSSARAGAETVGVVRVGAELGKNVGVGVGIEVSTDVRIEVDAEVGIKVVVEVRVASSGKS